MAERPLPAYDGEGAYVFVTYAHEDADLVYPHIRWLQDQGFNVWWDEGIRPGAAWRFELAQAIRGCSLLVYFVTPSSVVSEHCVREVNFALDEHHRPVLAIHLSETSLPDTLALSLSDRQAIFQYELPPDDYDRKVATALATYLDRPAGDVSRPGPRSRLRRPAWQISAFGLLAGAALASLITWVVLRAEPDATPTDTLPVVRVPFPLEGWINSMTLHSIGESSMAIAPEGDSIAYIAVNEDSQRVVRVRPTNGSAIRSLPGTEDTMSLFFSPDGQSIGVYRKDRLERVPISDGTPSSITAFSEKDFWGASWGEDDTVVYAVGRTGLKAVPVRGGKPTVVTEIDKSRAEGSHRLPHHVAGHNVLLYTVLIEEPWNLEIWAVDLSTGERRYLLDGSQAFYLSSGHIVVSKSEALYRGSLWMAPFDPDRMELTGSLEPIGVSTGSWFGRGWILASNGVLVYQPNQGGRRSSLVLMEPDGVERVIGENFGWESPVFSNDGKKIAVAQFAESITSEVRIYDLASGADYQFAESAGFPLWDPDDRGITYLEMGVGLVHQRLDAPESKRTVVPHPQVIVGHEWIYNGSSLAYTVVNRETDGAVYVLHADGRREHVYGRGQPTGAGLIPAGQWLALCTWPRGILVGKLPGFTSIANPSTEGCYPRWSNDGSKLYYHDYEKLWAIESETTTSGIVFGGRTLVTELAQARWPYDIDKNGRLVLVRNEFDNPRPPMLLLNWHHPQATD